MGKGRAGGIRLMPAMIMVLGGLLAYAPAAAAYSNPACPGAVSSTYTQCVFSGAGTYSLNVPAGTSSLDVVAVGAHGGSGGGGYGGVAASVEDKAVPVSAGAYSVVVGGVGADVNANVTAAPGGSPGGGGSAGTSSYLWDAAGGGGGFSGLLDPSGVPQVIAGGGGGGSGAVGSAGGGFSNQDADYPGENYQAADDEALNGQVGQTAYDPAPGCPQTGGRDI